MTLHLALLVIQSIVLGSLIGSYVHERPWSWTTWIIAVIVFLSMIWYSYRVLDAQPVQVTVVKIIDCADQYIS